MSEKSTSKSSGTGTSGGHDASGQTGKTDGMAPMDHSQMDHSKMDHSKMDHAAMGGAKGAPPERSMQDTMGHGGHGGMSMDSMIKDMRNRFILAAVLSIPITLWSPIGRDVFGFTAPTP